MGNLLQQITSDTVVKLLLRRGQESDRKNVVLTSGELGYTVDGKRVFVGDGVTQGGNLVGNLNFGVQQNINNFIGVAQPGDFIFQSFDNNNIPDNVLYMFSNNQWQAVHPTYGPAFTYNNTFDASRTGTLDFNPQYFYLNTVTGNFGVGTDVPGAKLTVAGGISAQKNVTLPNLPTITTDATNKLYVDQAIATAFGTGGFGIFLPLSGGIMTGGIQMNTNAISATNVPNTGVELANKNYIDGQITNLNNTIGATFLHLSGGIMTGGIQMNTNAISATNVPNTGVELANKNYVDIAVGNVPGGQGIFLPLLGGTMIGSIQMNTNAISASYTPTTSAHLTNKAYVDKAVAGGPYLPLTGGTMTGSIQMNTNAISASYTPTTSVHLTNKAYVDNTILANRGGAYVPLSGNATITNPLSVVTNNAGGLQITSSSTNTLYTLLQVNDTIGNTDGLVVKNNGNVALGSRNVINGITNATLTVGGTISASNNVTASRFFVTTAFPVLSSELTSKYYVDQYAGQGYTLGPGDGINTAAIFGSPAGNYTSVNGRNALEFRTLSAGTGISINASNNVITLSSRGAGIQPIYTRIQGDGRTTTFGLQGGTSLSAAAYRVDIDGVLQEPTVDYTVPAAAQIQFTVAPYDGAKVVVVSYITTDYYGNLVIPSNAYLAVQDSPTVNLTYNSNTGTLSADYIGGQQVTPPGAVTFYAGSTVPNGWVACDGNAYSIGNPGSTYYSLYQAIGGTYSNPTDINGGKFRVPNLQGNFIRGFNPATDGGTVGAPNTKNSVTVGAGTGVSIALLAIIKL